MRVLASLGCLALAGLAQTAELRLLAGGFPGYREVDDEAEGVRGLALDDHRGIAIQGEAVMRVDTGRPVHPWYLAGVALRFTDAEDEAGYDHAVIAGAWLLGVGVGVDIGHHAVVELGVVGAAGRASVADERGDAAELRDSSEYLGIEARAGLWFMLDRLRVGGVAGVAAHATFAEFQDTDGDTAFSSTYTGDGPFVLVGIGIELD